MSTYNGEKYLTEQIDSILAQKDVHVELFVRDDGSKDRTREILSRYAESHNNIHVEYGKNVGWCKSFVYALGNAPNFEFYAMSDQDDIWFEEKLITAVRAIRAEEASTDKDISVIWQSNTYATNENLDILRKTDMENRLHTIYSIIMWLLGIGCSMVMNAKARELAVRDETKKFLSDSSFDRRYVLLVCAIGGRIITEKNCYMKHRQHGDNVSGKFASISDRIRTAYINFTRSHGNEARNAKVLLQECDKELTNDARRALTIVAYHKVSWRYRFIIFFSPKFRTGLFRITLLTKLKALFGWL